MDLLAWKNRDKVVDLLAERLCFERASVKLYGKVLERVSRFAAGQRESSAGDYTTYGQSGYRKDVSRGIHDDIRHEMGGPGGAGEGRARKREERVLADVLPRLRAILGQEKGHEGWLEERIREFGGDPRRKTELTRLTSREMAGIEKVIKSDRELSHLFHALLAAEHVDTAGWDLLAELAEDAGDLAAKTEFEQRLHEEEHHIAFLREVLRSFSAHEVLEQDLRSPDQEISP